MDIDIRQIQWNQLNETNLETAAILLVIVASFLAITLPRRLVIVPLIAVALYIPYSQRFVIAGLDFDMVRIVLFATIIRLFLRGEFMAIRWNTLDKMVFYWAGAMMLIPCLVDPDKIVWACGFFLDNVIEYAVLRTLLTDENNLETVALWMILLSAPICAGMLLEQRSSQNLFGIFQADYGVNIRDDEIRSQAAFSHPIHAGTYGAMLIPLASLLWNAGSRYRNYAVFGVISGFIIVYTSQSSGPLYALFAGLLALGLWPLRGHITQIRRSFWATLLLLHLVMQGPVYSVVFRIPDSLGLVAGSTSYHRYRLIDQSIANFSEWWLLGTPRSIVASWGWGMQDVTNHFLVIGFASGLLGLCLFVLILVRAFSLVGKSLGAWQNDLFNQWRAWALGSLLFLHVTSFLGVSYFGGFWFFLHLTMAMISMFCGSIPVSETDAALPSANRINTIATSTNAYNA